VKHGLACVGIALALAITFGCGALIGIEDIEARADAGADGGATMDASRDAALSADGASCVQAPTVTGNETDFCDLEVQLDTRCGQCEACRQTNANNCVAIGSVLSASFKNALEQCEAQLPCGNYSSLANAPCISAPVLASGPTAAQAAVKDAYCNACASNVGECSSFFEPADAGTQAGVDAGVSGIGFLALLVNDTIAGQITANCIGGINCRPDLFELCDVAKFCASQGPDACDAGFCN
jgi:hypothetical protein